MMKKLLTLTLSVLTLSSIVHSQNVGVDVATPVQKLDVAGGLRLGTTSNGVAGSLRWNGSNFQVHDGTQWITFGTGSDLYWTLNGTHISPSALVTGNVGIGTNTPATKLQVVGTARVSALNVNGNYTLPITDGSAGFVLTTNGAGVVSWSDPAAVGDITAVTAGAGLVGGGTSGAVTLDVNAGDGIEIVSDQVRVKASDLDNATNGLTSTGNDFAVNVDNSTLDLNGDVLRVKPDGIGAAQIATGGVGSSEIADGSVASVDIATGGVTSTNILNGTILPADIASPGNSQILTTSGTGTVQWVTQGSLFGAQAGDGLVFDGTEVDVNPGDGITVASDQVSVNAAALEGNGLSVTTNNFNVNVDNATIEINADALRVKSGGIQSSHIANGTIVSADIATGGVTSTNIADGTIATTDIASPGNNQVLTTSGTGTVQWSTISSFTTALGGDGLVYDGVNAELDVNPGDGIEIVSDQVRVKASDLDNLNNGLTVTSNDFAINADNSTLEVNADVLRVKASGIQSSHILDNSITAADIATGGVATAEILNGTILPADISSPGSPNLVLSTNGSNVVGWNNPASLTTVLQDGDADTKITVDVAAADEDKIRMSTAGTQRMIIDNNGNVGIGVNAPEKNLQVTSATGGKVVVTRSGSTNNGNILGEIQFDSEAASGPSTVDASALIRGISANSGPAGDSDKGGHMAFLTKPATTDENVAATERMRITDQGNVGIGTNAPSGRLNVLNADGSNAVYGTSGNLSLFDSESYSGEVRLGAAWNRPGVYSSNELQLFSDNTGIIFGDSNVERMRMTAAGNLGIGTNAPAQKLEVVGNARITGLASANNLVLSNASGDLYNSSSLVGTGLGDNLGNHTATQALNMAANAINSAVAVNSSGDHLEFMRNRTDDNSYEWLGFYSGNTRQGIILYDGAWGGANSLLNEFSISSENNNKLTLNTNNGDIALMPKSGNVGVGTVSPGFKLHVPSGYIGTDYINTTDNSVGSGVTGVMIKAGDNYLRTGTAAAVATFLNTTGMWIPNNGSGDWQIASNSTGTSYSQASLELRETNFGGSGQQPPRLGFHWGGVVASQLSIESSGRISVRNNPGTGYENFVALDVSADREIYVNNWVRHSDNDGTYWSNTGWYIYPRNASDMYLRTGSGNGGIAGTIGDATPRGYVHWTTSNEIGFLDETRNWQLRTWNGGTEIYDITYMNDARPYIIYDRNNTAFYVDPDGTSAVNEIGWGDSFTRTQTKSDAGAIGSAKSGFYQTSAPAPSSNWYPGANSWQHLLEVRHSNTTNNYSMQIAGSFFDQEFWVRKTNNSGATGWSRMLTSSNIASLYPNVNGDNLGNHTATTTLNLNYNWLMMKPNVTVDVGDMGLSWHGVDRAYAMYQEAGAWNWPYPDLKLRFHTGLKFSAESSYGGIGIYANSGESQTALFNDAGLTMWRDIRLQDYNVWDVNNLTVNTIYDEEDGRVDIIDYVWFDNPASSIDMYFDSYGSDPHLRPGSAWWGYVGRPQNFWYLMYAGGGFITMSQRAFKRDITPVNDNLSIEDHIIRDIDNLRPSLYKLNEEKDDMVAGFETKYRPQYHLGLILDESPDYIQDNEFSGIDIYALSTMSMVGVKRNREDVKSLKEEISELKEGRGMAKIADFGTSTIHGESLWVEFDTEFSSQLTNGEIPVISVMPHALGAEIALVEKTSKGFRIQKIGSDPLTVDWTANAKINAVRSETPANKGQEETIPQNVLDQLVVPQAAKEKSKRISEVDKEMHEAYQAKFDGTGAVAPEGLTPEEKAATQMPPAPMAAPEKAVTPDSNSNQVKTLAPERK